MIRLYNQISERSPAVIGALKPKHYIAILHGSDSVNQSMNIMEIAAVETAGGHAYAIPKICPGRGSLIWTPETTVTLNPGKLVPTALRTDPDSQLYGRVTANYERIGIMRPTQGVETRTKKWAPSTSPWAAKEPTSPQIVVVDNQVKQITRDEMQRIQEALPSDVLEELVAEPWPG